MWKKPFCQVTVIVICKMTAILFGLKVLNQNYNKLQFSSV